MENPTSDNQDNLPTEDQEKQTPPGKAGLTKKDGINAFLANQDQKPRPEDILFSNPDDIENAEDIISSGTGSE